MRVLETETVFCGPIGGEKSATIECSKEERARLIEALKIVENFKFQAREVLKHRERKDADWTEYSFDIKDNVKVNIRYGACG
jgi:hypothetical protein